MPRRRRRLERQKSNSLNRQNNNSARAARFFVHFFVVTAREEDVNKRRLNFLTLSEPARVQKSWGSGDVCTQAISELESCS